MNTIDSKTDTCLDKIPNNMMDYFTKLHNNDLGPSFIRCIDGLTDAIVEFAVGPYFLPTLFAPRNATEYKMLDKPYRIGFKTGRIIGFGVLFTEVYFAFPIIKNHPEVLSIPVATNIASKLYEVHHKFNTDSQTSC